jgi:MFS family permease
MTSEFRPEQDVSPARAVAGSPANQSVRKGQVLPFRESLLAMTGIAFVVMLVALDQTVVSTALPTVVAELQGFEFYAWVATAYLLTSVITVPIFGRLGDYYGRKPFVLASIVVFVAASALCGMATNMPFLVAARALQGSVAACWSARRSPAFPICSLIRMCACVGRS